MGKRKEGGNNVSVSTLISPCGEVTHVEKPG